MFWATAAAMVALGLAFVLPPLLGKRRNASARQDELNVSLFQQRSRELETDLKNGVISQTQFDSAQQDLEVELAADLDAVQAGNEPRKAAGGGAWLSALGVGLTVPLIAVVIYVNLGTSDPEEAQRRLAESRNPGAGQQPDIGAMVAGLQARLQEQPDDLEGWIMLGRSLVVMERYDEAVSSYEQSIARFPDNADLLASFAEASALSAQGNFAGRARELLGKALTIDPDHTRALWFAGLADFQASDFSQAIEKWERLIAAFPEGSKERELAAASIERARTSMSGEASPAANERPQTPPAADSDTASSRLTVEVSLAEHLSGKVSGEDALFIFARAVEGPRMPLAVVKKQVKDLPLSVELSDSQAMTPAMTLSKFTEVELTARVSRSGQPTPGSGDLQGVVSPVDTGTREPVKLVVDSEIP